MGHSSNDIRNDFETNYNIEKSSLKLPALFIDNWTEELAILISSVDTGELPVLIQYEGQLRELLCISKRAKDIAKLTKIYDCEIWLKDGSKICIKENSQLLDINELYE